jgi:hypothetical protein
MTEREYYDLGVLFHLALAERLQDVGSADAQAQLCEWLDGLELAELTLLSDLVASTLAKKTFEAGKPLAADAG